MSSNKPLAELLRPTTLDEVVGQEHLLGPGRILRNLVEAGNLPSLILWGPPGSGKTTLAHLLAKKLDARFVTLSAVTAGVKDVREVVEEANKMTLFQHKTVLFLDEIHRFNRAQQDALLPHVENGTLTLIGATTENPSFEINRALLSRVRIFALKKLTEDQLIILLRQAVEKAAGWLGQELNCGEGLLEQLAYIADGDARRALTLLEVGAWTAASRQCALTIELLNDIADKPMMIHDKNKDSHYHLVSAFIKSMRGSDVDAALYYMQRMLQGGEDPMFILRRMMIFASEDIGLADSTALAMVTRAKEAVELVGLPEGEFALTHAAVYLALAPKSNSICRALMASRELAARYGNLEPPLQVINAVTTYDKKELGYGQGYAYAHDYPDHIAPMQFLPDEIKNAVVFAPQNMGRERDVCSRSQYIDQILGKPSREHLLNVTGKPEH